DEMLAKTKKPENAPTVGTPKPAPKREEFVTRASFNTVQNEATFKTEWKTDSDWRVESGGIRLATGKGEVTSLFQLIDNWKLVVVIVPEAQIQVEVNQESFNLSASTTVAGVLTIERKGKKLGYTFEQSGRVRSSNVIQLKDDRLGPSAITIRTENNPNSTFKTDGTLLQRPM